MDKLGPYGRTKREDRLLQLRHLFLVHAAEGGRLLTRREAQVAVFDAVGDATQNSHCLLNIGKALDFVETLANAKNHCRERTTRTTRKPSMGQ